MSPFPDYPIPADEEQRLRDLERHGVLDGPPDEHIDRIVRLASAVLGMPIALVSLVDRDRQWFLSRLGLEAQQTPREMAFCAHAIAGDVVLVVPDALEDDRFRNNPLVLEEPRVRFYAGAPLRSREGHNLGTLCVIDRQPRQLSPGQVQVLHDLAELVVRELELRRLTGICPVTGLYNRGTFFRLCEREVERARQEGRPLSLLNIDIDDFRQINNRWGHEAGDRVLLDICRLCRARLGEADLFGRIGDEEFALLLVDRDSSASMDLAETIRAEISAMGGVFNHSGYQPHVSGGLSSLAPSDRSFADLFYRADQALYLAKGNGRDQIATVLGS